MLTKWFPCSAVETRNPVSFGLRIRVSDLERGEGIYYTSPKPCFSPWVFHYFPIFRVGFFRPAAH